MKQKASPYIPTTNEDQFQMLKEIGVNNFQDLLDDLPQNYLWPNINLKEMLSEPELTEYFKETSKLNNVVNTNTSFLGAGAYNHYIPSTVQAMIQRGEFLTSYTPYQPEASQGTLQVGFEFQSLVSQLFEMEVCNAGMYDGPTALAEGALMACRIKKNDKIIVHESISERFLDVLKSYTKWQNIDILKFNEVDFSSDIEYACLLVQSPNYLGEIEDVESLSNLIHKKNGLLVQHTYPTSLGLLKPPGKLNVDISTAEGQPLGVPLSLGGPYIGILTCKKEFIRQLPGRIIGKTVDENGKTAYALTLQTREQHIRRERATSNICTSTQLIGLMVAVYLATLGPMGLKKISEICYHRAHYLSNEISKISGFKIISKNFFNEFVTEVPMDPKIINEFLLKNNIEGGLDVSKNKQNLLMFAVTELNTPEEINRTIEILKKV